VRRAVEAVYRAKRVGKGRFEIADAEVAAVPDPRPAAEPHPDGAAR